MPSGHSLFRQTDAFVLLESRRDGIDDVQLRQFLSAYFRHIFDALPWLHDELEDVLFCIECRTAGMTINDSLPEIQEEVDRCADEYCESLNDAAEAMRCLVDIAPLQIDDAANSVGHLWNALLCNFEPTEFVAHESQLISSLLPSN